MFTRDLMRRTMIVAAVLAAPAASQSGADATARIAAAAQTLVKSLDDSGRAKVQFRWDDSEQRKRWSNLPSPMVERRGIRMGDLTDAQRANVMALLREALSPDGYRKVTEIMRGDEVLRVNGDGRGGGGRGGRGPGGGGPAFGLDNYWLAFLGTPSTTAPWMLQFGGHHLAINLTLGGTNASITPSLPAAQPATYTFEGKEIRPLGRENDKAFALINALDAAQQGQAILKYRVSDLVLGPTQDGRTIQPEGIRASALTSKQQEMLLDLAKEWAGIVTDAFATPRMAELRAKLSQTYFAWSGPTTNGGQAYFRIQGPTVVIEYAPQGSIDHIHTIYRDPTNDYGAKFAK
ncbi:MAG TPA: DUF3500 domain-containing protein [Vicinamibacterales bacterium]|jgi:hypothetical protein|nr:DUF3500 domain-containing protein [Vicinamibacterales bacterium]